MTVTCRRRDIAPSRDRLHGCVPATAFSLDGFVYQLSLIVACEMGNFAEGGRSLHATGESPTRISRSRNRVLPRNSSIPSQNSIEHNRSSRQVHGNCPGNLLREYFALPPLSKPSAFGYLAQFLPSPKAKSRRKNREANPEFRRPGEFTSARQPGPGYGVGSRYAPSRERQRLGPFDGSRSTHSARPPERNAWLPRWQAHTACTPASAGAIGFSRVRIQ